MPTILERSKSTSLASSPPCLLTAFGNSVSPLSTSTTDSNVVLNRSAFATNNQRSANNAGTPAGFRALTPDLRRRSPSGASRCLFGRPDARESVEIARREISAANRRLSTKYNFDFERCIPLPGRFIYEKIEDTIAELVNKSKKGSNHEDRLLLAGLSPLEDGRINNEENLMSMLVTRPLNVETTVESANNTDKVEQQQSLDTATTTATATAVSTAQRDLTEFYPISKSKKSLENTSSITNVSTVVGNNGLTISTKSKKRMMSATTVESSNLDEDVCCSSKRHCVESSTAPQLVAVGENQ